MNNSALKLFHELMKKGWIDRNDNSLMWNLVEDNEARDELDQMGIELGFEIIQAQDRIYMVPTQDNDLFLKNNVDYRADIKATNEVRSRDLYLMNYLAIYILFIFFKGEGVDALTRDFTTKEELIKEFTKHCQDVTRDDIDKDDKTDDYSENFHMLAEDWLSKKEGEITSKRIDILLEWNLDGSKEKLLTGISIAASSSASTEEDKRGNSVKYYTFTTHYDTFSAYSISSLELSSNDNGNYVPAQFDYVREKAKSSRGLLTYYSSDDAVKWAEFLAEYGIFRTEWESVIEVLNKDEGGLNQYFDEAKTSDKLIAKFFIPAIEQKLMSVASQGTDCSLETMLINYAKKITDKESVIKQRDTNKKLLEDLEGVSEISDDLYNANDAFVANVSETRGFAAALGNRMNAVNEETGRGAQEIEGQNILITRIDYEKKSKNYYVASEKRDRVKADMEEALALLEQSKATLVDIFKNGIDISYQALNTFHSFLQ